MESSRAPLFEKLSEEFALQNANFHVPGHKSGAGLDAAGRDFLAAVMAVDYTEITGLDDLHHPTGAIREAQELAAECFGAEETHFLVNGSTVGNLAMILALCSPGSLLIVQRNVHKSVIHGLVLAGAEAVFLQPQVDEATGLAVGVKPEDVEAALRKHPEAKGVFLSNPNYYGMASDLTVIAEIVHLWNKPLAVDEAHGAHFGFHPELPKSALSCGADAVVQSTHKMLTAMTMGAMLHIQGERMNRETVKRYLGMLQSSSPSYPIMASLDLSRKQMQERGRELWDEGLETMREVRNRIHALPFIDLVEKGEDSPYVSLDPFKVTIVDQTGAWTGYELQEALEARGCMTEMADPVYVLLHFTFSSTRRDVDKLLKALQEISEVLGNREKEINKLEIKATDSKNVVCQDKSDLKSADSSVSNPVRISWNQEDDLVQVRTVSVDKAEGFKSAEMIIPYPPGIPVLYPGEVITGNMVSYLAGLTAAGAKFQGASDDSLRTIRILKSPMI